MNRIKINDFESDRVPLKAPGGSEVVAGPEQELRNNCVTTLAATDRDWDRREA